LSGDGCWRILQVEPPFAAQNADGVPEALPVSPVSQSAHQVGGPLGGILASAGLTIREENVFDLVGHGYFVLG
jgi:hypothetical protein